MKTISESIKTWQEGDKEKSYQFYLQDDGSFDNITFDNFCILFVCIVKKHEENLKNEEAHSKLIYD